jgi:hypothetical protein
MGTCACQNPLCGATVQVYTDRNNMAYYKCGPCGIKVTHSIMKHSQKFLATITAHTDPDAAPPAPTPTPAPAEPEKKGFFHGVLT